MKLIELKREMDARFAGVDGRFDVLERRVEQMQREPVPLFATMSDHELRLRVLEARPM